MASPRESESIARLRSQLAASRAQLSEAGSGLGESFDVPRRVRREVASHPLKWALVAVAGGVVAARVLPLALGLVRTAASRRLVGTLISTVGPLAWRAGVNALVARRPDLVESWLGMGPAEPPEGAGSRGQGV